MNSRPLSLSLSTPRDSLIQTVAVLLVGLIPPSPAGSRLHATWEISRLPEGARADREKRAGGYYEGLIGVESPGAAKSNPAFFLASKSSTEPRFTDANISRKLPGDMLMYELLPNIERSLYGLPFTTNEHGMRDRPCSLERRPKTVRIAVLGSSIDMGWGVGTEETYVNLVEDWLNDQAEKRGGSVRFEVLNFAVAAYSPLQRLEAFRRKAAGFRPDVVLYSATTLDIRLLEIHLCDMLQNRVDLTYDFLRDEIKGIGLGEKDLALDAQDRLRNKNGLKAKLRPHYWPVYDKSIERLAEECRAIGAPLAAMIIPRSGEGESPKARAPMVAQLRSMLDRHADVVLDLSGSFDGLRPTDVEISASDDHPNALGHDRLSKSLAKALETDARLRRVVFSAEDPELLEGEREHADARPSAGYLGPEPIVASGAEASTRASAPLLQINDE